MVTIVSFSLKFMGLLLGFVPLPNLPGLGPTRLAGYDFLEELVINVAEWNTGVKIAELKD